MQTRSLKLLLIDPNKVFQTILAQTFQARGVEVVCCDSSQAALQLLASQSCDLICVAWNLPDGGGIALCRAIRAIPAYRRTPLALCAAEFSPGQQAEALRAGATDVFLRQEVSQLANFFIRLVGQAGPLAARILYVEDSIEQSRLVLAQLASNGLAADWVASAEEALIAIGKYGYDLVLVDVNLGTGMNGVMLARRIRRMDGVRNEIPILALTAFDDTAQRIELFNIGIDDYVIKPVIEEELMARIRRLVERQKLMAEVSAHKDNLESSIAERTRDLVVARSQLQATVDAIPDLLFELDLEGRYYSVHAPRNHLLAASPEALLGRTINEMLAPEAAAVCMAALRDAAEFGEASGRQYRLDLPQGVFWFELSISRKSLDVSQAARFVGLARDITDRKNAEDHANRQARLYASLTRCNQAIVHSTCEEDLLTQVCQIAVESGGVAMAWVGMVVPATLAVRPLASFGASAKFLDGIQISVDADSPFGRGPSGTAIRERRPVWCQSMDDAMAAPWRERIEKAGWVCSATLPIYRNGAAVGALNMYAGTPEFFDADARQLLVEIAADVSYALDNFARDDLRKQAEFALRDSEYAAHLAVANARSALEQLKLQKYALDQHAIVATVDVRGKITYANDKFCEISGYSRAELLGQDHVLINSHVHPKGFFKAMYERIARGEVWHGEVCNRARDGHLYWVDTTIVPFMGADGKPEQYIAIRADISERKQAEKLSLESERALNEAQRISSIGSYFTDLETGIWQGSASLDQIFGIDASFIKNIENWGGLIDPEHQQEVVDHYHHVVQSDGKFDKHYKVIRPCDGQVRWVAALGEFVFDAGGKPVTLRGTIQDITERKAAELELQRHRDHLEELVAQQTEGLQHSMVLTQRALAELEQQKFVLDEHAVVTICDVDGRITYGNDKFSQLSGYSRAEFMGQDHRLVNSGYHAKGFFKAMYETIACGEVWHAEVCNRAKDGSLYWVDSTVAAFMGSDGKPREYIAVRTDITERKRIEAAAHAANRAKSEFLANMSHEIRTPMNGVVGMVDILQQTALSPEQQRMLGTIHDSSLALLHILNDILDYSKIEAGKLAMESIPTHLREVAEGVVQLMETISSAKSLDLLVFVSPDLPHWIVSDPTRLRQVLLNLLGNAVKFTASQSGRPGQVMLRADPCTLLNGLPGLRLRVIDNGIGISPEALPQLFQPFTQADESTVRKFGGTGLGLSITQRLVEMMEGRIAVHSTIGEGSEFSVELPLVEAVPREAPAPGLVPPVEASLCGIHVLVVSSDPTALQILPPYCIAAGAEVTTVADLAAARALLQQAPQSAGATVVLLGLSVTAAAGELDLPAEVGVVRLVRRGHLAAISEIAVAARPLLYLGFNRSMQRFGEIVQPVLRSLVFSWGAHSVSSLWH